ncbi:FMN-binding protein [Nocardioides sp. Kera G14]|uniref:FMN-binding protein n=1 Tax=Nocardioides sp. Kera G14 TaxID=2884264 RepID=UPI001D112107|nr:FMN-binding protein [Nocardioides sp. Kera G14]UDY22356.1 FMN-binding protein [Nocardioides sp. Kera G14]
MSVGGKVASVLTAAGVIGVGWWVGSQNDSTATVVTDTSTSSGSTSVSPTAAGSSSSGTGTPSATASSTASSGTYTGSTESDRYGELTVTVTMSSGKISDITYTSTAHDGHSLEIESRAIPTLKSEAVEANSADIDTVSGATYTSTKYKTSLQSALDKA